MENHEQPSHAVEQQKETLDERRFLVLPTAIKIHDPERPLKGGEAVTVSYEGKEYRFATSLLGVSDGATVKDIDPRKAAYEVSRALAITEAKERWGKTASVRAVSPNGRYLTVLMESPKTKDDPDLFASEREYVVGEYDVYEDKMTKEFEPDRRSA